MRNRTWLATALATLLTSSAASADVVTEWNLEAVDTGRRLADSRISAWDTKYQYGFWRPITAIAGVDPSGDAGADAAPDSGTSYDDGNPATEPDPTWLPLLETPNHPSYSSGHS